MSIRTRAIASQADLDQASIRLFGIFQAREEEFAFNPSVVVEYPDIADAGMSPLLSDPIAYINRRVKTLERNGKQVSRVAILTTFGDNLCRLAWLSNQCQSNSLEIMPGACRLKIARQSRQ